MNEMTKKEKKLFGEIVKHNKWISGSDWRCTHTTECDNCPINVYRLKNYFIDCRSSAKSIIKTMDSMELLELLMES